MDAASVMTQDLQYTYDEPEVLVFMNLESFEEIRVAKEVIGDKILFLKEGAELKVLVWNDKVIDVQLPGSIELMVTETADPQSGATKGKDKPATLETGAVITVPAFIKTGELIRLDPEKKNYMERASAKK